MATVLVIIDMQPDAFPAAKDEKTIQSILRLIQKAKKTLSPIIILEYEALHGREDDYATCFEIVDEIGNYKYASFIIKEQDDGSYEASEEFLKYIPSRQVKKIEVCGVNICACVRQTAEGLARIFPQAKVVVVKKACNDLYYGKDNGFDEYRKDMRNLVLV